MNNKLEKVDPWLERIIAFLLCYTVYVFCAILVIIGIYLTLGLQWFVNAYLDPAEPVGFLICGVSVIYGIIALGVYAWERGTQ